MKLNKYKLKCPWTEILIILSCGFSSLFFLFLRINEYKYRGRSISKRNRQNINKPKENLH